MTTVVLLGTLDTKGAEYQYLRERVIEGGVSVLMVDAGIQGVPSVEADVSRNMVAAAAGSSIAEILALGDRGTAIELMAEGARRVVADLHASGRLDGIAGLGGTGGSSLISHAMQALPVGVPKFLVSTVAAGDTRPYVGGVDITMMYSVVDIAGINRISARILSNAAGAIVGMAKTDPITPALAKPVVGATMFGVTTPCVTTARSRLEELGYEVLVFHATGAGGRSLEALVRGGLIDAVLDVTTTELADNLVGGVFSAGPERLTAAARKGVTQVVSLGALDMVNFGPEDTVPPKFASRLFHRHNASVTLMRTTPEECAALGREIAAKISAASGPTALFIPTRGISQISTEGGVFHDPAADEALLGELRANLHGNVEVIERDCAINDESFAREMADHLHKLYSNSKRAD